MRRASTTKLAADILAVEPTDPSQPVRIPGYRGAKRREEFIASGTLGIDDEDWEKFEMALKEMSSQK